MEQPKWAGTTQGTPWMHKWLVKMLWVIDRRVLYAFVGVFVIPFYLLFNRGRTHIYHYFRRRLKYSPIRSMIATYVNHYQFSQVVIDKFAMYAGAHFHNELDGYDHYQQLASRPEGFILLSSHIGNYEIAGYSLKADTKNFNAVVFGGEKQSVMGNRQKMFNASNINMIPICPDMSHLFEINEALARGEVVSMPADRILGSKKRITVPFLDSNVELPLGPFHMATLRGLEVIAVNVMKTRWNSYHVHITPLHYDSHKSRKEQSRELAEAYVAELTRMLKLYPTQWYNYFDFWKDDN